MESGYRSYQKEVADGEPRVYQKANTIVSTTEEVEDSITYYTMMVEKAPLPKLKDMEFAEDLLQCSSHEVLKEVFGDANVVQDIFQYSEKEKNNCSILFPNTSREVIFIWSDEDNYRKPDFLIVGGHLQTFGNTTEDKQLAQNEWHSRQGVFPGMRLSEVHKLNGNAISFYGWGTEQAGMLAPANKGKLDFSKLGLVFNCLDCGNTNTSKAKIINSDAAMEEDKRIYISSMIILPEKNKSISMK